MQPFFGYPGGKSRGAKYMRTLLPLDVPFGRYIEPCAGGFSVGLSLLDKGVDMWINDFDPDLVSLWEACLRHPEELCELVQTTQITPERFYDLRQRLMDKPPYRKSDVLFRAIDKLVLHKISFSNLGEMSGSPVGGKHQTGKWKFDYRWNPKSICKRIMDVSSALKGTKVTCLDYKTVFSKSKNTDLMYIDPPYVGAGEKCYKHFFNESDHQEMRREIDSLDCYWFMTYDNHPVIRELYSDFYIQDLQFGYSMSSTNRAHQEIRQGKEILISNFQG